MEVGGYGRFDHSGMGGTLSGVWAGLGFDVDVDDGFCAVEDLGAVVGEVGEGDVFFEFAVFVADGVDGFECGVVVDACVFELDVDGLGVVGGGEDFLE